MPEQDTAPRHLTDEQISEIIPEDVLPPLARVTPQATPRMLVLGGPQESCKTTLQPVVAE
ncbi:hypothetical protein [Streptomyces sp. E2N166]|uniref:hypothetical protein n=1 Tax=Streptomyces sp. E2N166 TaxID=1851909 RepID=UPI000EF750F7|nr:hypothetical protein [Streptomyces sp. E2N166]